VLERILVRKNSAFGPITHIIFLHTREDVKNTTTNSEELSYEK